MKPHNKTGLYARTERGFTLIEILMATALGSLILASGSKFMYDRVEDIKDQATAQYQQKMTVASERFINDNLATIASTLTINGPARAYPLTTIRDAGYLSSGMTPTNPYRQTPCLVVRRLPDSGTGTPRLEALVTTEGGTAIPEVRVPFVAAQGGIYGGFVPANAPTTAQGAYGVWTVPLAAFNGDSCTGLPVTANRLAFTLFFDGVGAASGSINVDGLLHRNVVAGRPDLNTMNTSLNMGGFDISNARNVTISDTLTAATANVTGQLTAGTTRTAGETYTGGSFHTLNDGGWTNDKWGGGWTMVDGTAVRSVNDKDVTTGGEVTGGTIHGLTQVVSDGETITNNGTNTTNSDAFGFFAKNAASAANVAPKSPAGSANFNDVFLRSASSGSGRWLSDVMPKDRFAAVYYGKTMIGPYTNTSTLPVMIMAYGGNDQVAGTKPCDLTGWIGDPYDIRTKIIGAGDNDPAYARECSMTYIVPSGMQWHVTSMPPPTNSGNIVVYAYAF
jgi:prepilin-type N-terminal cleavage/methylation domain-containing protein